MSKIFQEYGGVIITVIAVVCLITLVAALMAPGGVLDGAFGNITNSFVDKAEDLIGAGPNAGGSSGEGGFGGSSDYVDGEYTYVGVDTTDLGEMTWEQLIADSKDGTYATKYKVGNTLTLTMKDGSKAQFRIVGINHDDLADGTGKAHLTLISENTLVNQKMNATGTNAGGWEASAMRTYLQGDYMDTYIPDDVKASIVEVSKQTYTHDGTHTQTTSDQLWIPSYTEVGFTANTTLASYDDGEAYAYFTDNASRTKTGSHTRWWLRSAHGDGSNFFYSVISDGSSFYYYAYLSDGVALGFCI